MKHIGFVVLAALLVTGCSATGQVPDIPIGRYTLHRDGSVILRFDTASGALCLAAFKWESDNAPWERAVPDDAKVKTYGFEACDDSRRPYIP